MADIIMGMLAHVDAGKTTLTESLLFESGVVSSVGRVDHGTAFLDTDDIEKRRGITIYSKEARFSRENTSFTLLDTPGHVDFSPEMERTLSVIDYGILVVSGSEGVQSHTETLWNLLRKHQIPTFFFINKMDLEGSDKATLMRTLKERCSEFCVDCTSLPEMEEEMSLCDEGLMEQYLDTGHLGQEVLKDLISESKVFPCFFGSALKLEGISPFLSYLSQTCRSPYHMDTQDFSGKKFGGKVFKITRDSSGTRLTHMKITSGNLAVRDLLETGEKVTELRLYSGNKFKYVDSVASGSICAVGGLTTTFAGQSLGIEKPVPKPVLAPVLTYGLALPSGSDPIVVLKQLKELQEEDPALEIQWLPIKQAIQVQIMGDVQIEVLTQVILDRFSLEVAFTEREIIYRETIAQGQTFYGVGHFEPLRHYAEVVLELSPLPSDSGLRLDVSKSCSLPTSYQQLILQHLREGILSGVLTGSPLTDVHIQVLDGKFHQKHTEGGDFREATLRAFRQGLMQATSLLLEPWMSLEFYLPTECVGRGMSDVQRMGGVVSSPELCEEDSNFSVLEGEAPLSRLGNYQSTVLSYTQGRGRVTSRLLGYRPCENASSVIKKIGYNPDADPHFPCDSIFCKQGAGYSVPWEEVHSHCHCVLPKEEVEEEETVEIHRQRVTHYKNQLAEDEDLLAIFQRTYGVIAPEKLARPSWKKSDKCRDDSSGQGNLRKERSGGGTGYGSFRNGLSKKERYLLVDGYNIIFAWEDLKALGEDHLDSARVSLLNLLCNYQAFYHCTVIVVFDAYKVKGGTGTVEPYYNITQVFTKEAETADMYIEKVTHSLGGEYDVRVATSDALEQRIILGHGALRVSARGLEDEIKSMNRAMRKFLE